MRPDRKEKANDSVSRHPHACTGELMNKTGLLDKPPVRSMIS